MGRYKNIPVQCVNQLWSFERHFDFIDTPGYWEYGNRFTFINLVGVTLSPLITMIGLFAGKAVMVESI